MSAVAGLIQIVGGIAAAPLLPGIVQALKARLQGRRGPSPLQPYRELRRLWRKLAVEPAGTSAVYRYAPCVVAAASVLALLLVPVGGRSAGWPFGNDAILLAGTLALARFAITAAAWDTGSGFAPMGAARDLMIAVFAEALLLLTLLLAALEAGSTDLVAMVRAASGSSVWSEPAHWCAAGALLLVLLVETGRQPIDNPDTHLELTMIHEGPLLEYAGRDLAYLQWAAAARHWLVFVLAAQVFLPHPSGVWWQLVTLAVVLVLLCGALALVETLLAKMRVLLVPRLLALGAVAALLGIAASLVESL
jgi:formate hydrogenlyase subunit 4